MAGMDSSDNFKRYFFFVILKRIFITPVTTIYFEILHVHLLHVNDVLKKKIKQSLQVALTYRTNTFFSVI